ncbi:arylsulfatase A-like enzyme [Hephaestia caeni]|uniref:Arylsulfatase A-like enzyme n=2 Tax=Hephaestia caeni TaxID=645617 RepID=A0A397PDQ9_9SPHN|nr:arylsulfatase A-like enzyme [Hephaestia caeni]
MGAGGMKRRELLLSFLASTVPLGAADALAQATPRPAVKAGGGAPNIILMVSDQHRAGMTKATGYPLDTSPGLDALARRGVRFDHAYCTAPLCVPSRISMLTGRWPEAHRVRMNLAARDAFYTQDLYDVAKASGYRTGLAGKNHTYRTAKSLDFWREYSHVSGHKEPNADPRYAAFDAWMKQLGAGSLSLEPTPFSAEVQYPYRIVSDAIDFIDGSGDQPFLLQVGFPEPHTPQQVPKPYWDMFPPDKVPPRAAGPEALEKLGARARWLFELEERADVPDEAHWQRYVSNYLGALRMIDDQLVRLVKHLEARGMMENTVIVYVADHGDYVMDYGLGRKGVGLSEALTRIPMIFAGAGIKANTLGGVFTSNADLMPTLCEAMGAEIPLGVQGRSLWPILQGKPYPADEFRSIYAGVGVGGLYYDDKDDIALPPRGAPTANGGEDDRNRLSGDTLNKVTQSGNAKMVRMGAWKLVYDMMGYGQLYHLPTDPHELNNRFGQPDVAREQAALMAELAMWTIRAQDSLPTGPQNRKYQTKWARPHNWYAPYRRAPAGSAFIP